MMEHTHSHRRGNSHKNIPRPNVATEARGAAKKTQLKATTYHHSCQDGYFKKTKDNVGENMGKLDLRALLMGTQMESRTCGSSKVELKPPDGSSKPAAGRPHHLCLLSWAAPGGSSGEEPACH